MADSTKAKQPEPPPVERVPPPADATAVAVPSGERSPERSRPRADRVARTNGRPENVEEMRREIDRTRARMSDTLDAIEARIEHQRASLERRKEKVVDQVTLKPVRERLGREPWRTLAIAFAAGYIIAAIRD